NGETTDFRDLRNHFNLPALKMLQYQEYLDNLMDKKILIARFDHRVTDGKPFEANYSLSAEFASAISEKRLPESNTVKPGQTALDVLEKVYKTTDRAMESRMKKKDYYARYSEIIAESEHLEFVKSIRSLELSMVSEIVFMCTIWKQLSTNEGLDLNDAAMIAGNDQDRILFKQGIFKKEDSLIKKELIITVPGILDSFNLSLSTGGSELLSSFGISLPSETEKKNARILPAQIAEKQLFYNDLEKDQITSLETILLEENYKALKTRLADKNLPVGLNVLLYGSPGTGKTETVFQLARQSGREIMRVEISQTKSKWFGESEKIIKEIFTNYATYARSCEQMPILLFNEADAILSIRNTSTEGNTRQTENAIQNILLEELEKFEGIFFATTNLAKNLDKAFERRFLYKVEFAKPGIMQRRSILEKKLPYLSSDACEKIAEQYDLSGGQIENIARKSEIHFIMHGTPPDKEKIIQYCSEELTVNAAPERKSIGFGKQTQ
ncbi:MAG: ATP-binding protein, partial [Flavobacteriales bacterium]